MFFLRYFFVAIYSLELIIKLIVKGFFVGPYAYLKDPWNWLDFILVIVSYELN